MTLTRPTGAPALYSQDGLGFRAVVHEHYFVGSCDWLVTEYSPDDDLAFGWACLNGDRQNAELGYVSIAELESVQIPLNITLNVATNPDDVARPYGHVGVERDEGWPEGLTLTEAIAHLDRRQGLA